jgi:hypothetical protein
LVLGLVLGLVLLGLVLLGLVLLGLVLGLRLLYPHRSSVVRMF